MISVQVAIMQLGIILGDSEPVRISGSIKPQSIKVGPGLVVGFVV